MFLWCDTFKLLIKQQNSIEKKIEMEGEKNPFTYKTVSWKKKWENY